jgi:hypothetical protein
MNKIDNLSVGFAYLFLAPIGFLAEKLYEQEEKGKRIFRIISFFFGIISLIVLFSVWCIIMFGRLFTKEGRKVFKEDIKKAKSGKNKMKI